MHHENFWMSAESGYWTMMSNKKEWHPLFHLPDRKWIDTIRTIMEDYCENIDGATVEERSCSIVWNYRVADDHGHKFAKELCTHLQQLTGVNSPIEVKQGNGYIEVLPVELTKQKYLTYLFQRVKQHMKQKIESFLYIGAELTDDTVFQFIKDRVDENKHQSMNEQSQSRTIFTNNCKASICVVGKRPSSAPYYMEQKDLGILLQEIALKSQTRKKNASQTDLLDEYLLHNNDIINFDSEHEDISHDSFEAKRNPDFRTKSEHRKAFRQPSLPPFKPIYTPDETIFEKKSVDEESVYKNDEKNAEISDKKERSSKENLNAQTNSPKSSSYELKNFSLPEIKNVKTNPGTSKEVIVMGEEVMTPKRMHTDTFEQIIQRVSSENITKVASPMSPDENCTKLEKRHESTPILKIGRDSLVKQLESDSQNDSDSGLEFDYTLDNAVQGFNQYDELGRQK